MNQMNEVTKDTVEVKLFDFGKIAGFLIPKEKATAIHLKDKSLVNTANLMELLDCGKHTAIEIGNKAGAKVCIGRKLFWNVKLIRSILIILLNSDKSIFLKGSDRTNQYLQLHNKRLGTPTKAIS